MKILLVSDHEEPYLWDYYRPGHLSGVDLILSAGDLKASYLEFLVTMANRPLVYVRGNHDGLYETHPPEGCDCAEDKLLKVRGLRILGLGGSGWYSGGSNQYTERQMRRRIRRLCWKIKWAGGVDIILAHAPARGYGDDDSPAHRGFEAFLPLIDKLQHGGQRKLQHRHAGSSADTSALLLAPLMGRVVGADSEDKTRGQGLTQGLAVGCGLDGGIALNKRALGGVIGICEPNVGRAGLGRELFVLQRAIAEQLKCSGGGNMKYVQVYVCACCHIQRCLLTANERMIFYGRLTAQLACVALHVGVYD